MAQGFIIDPKLTKDDAVSELYYRLYHIEQLCDFPVSQGNISDPLAAYFGRLEDTAKECLALLDRVAKRKAKA